MSLINLRLSGVTFFVLAALTLAGLPASRVLAETITWNGDGGDNSWHVAANWDLDRVPGTGDDVVIPAVGPSADVRYINGSSTSIISLTCDKPFVLTNGTLDISAASAFTAAYTQSGGGLSGSGAITVSGLLTWTGGGMGGSGTTMANGGMAISLPDNGSAGLSGSRNLVIPAGSIATLAAVGVNVLDMYDTSTLTISGTLNITAAGGSVLRQVTGNPQVLNNGIVNKSSAGTFTIITTFHNNNAVNVNNGTLRLSHVGSHGGSFGGAGKLAFTEGNFSFTATSSITTQDVDFTGGTVTIAGTYIVPGMTTLTGGTTNFNSTAAIATYNQSGGGLSGSGAVNVSGLLTWTGGGMGGSGTTTANGGMAISLPDNGSAGLSGSRNLVIPAGSTAALGGTGNVMDMYNTSTLTISGTLNITAASGSVLRPVTGNPQVLNNGIFNKTSAGTFTIDPPFNNNGTVNVQTGTQVQLTGLNNFSGTTLTGGTYNIAGTLKFTGANIVTNAATIVLDGPASAIVNQANANAIANFATNAVAGSFHIKNGRNYARTGVFNNAGQIKIGPGASTFSATGDYIQTSGTTLLEGGALDPTNLAHIQGGSFGGTGTVAGNVTNSGIAIPDLFAGCLHVSGNYVQTPTGSIEIEKAGPTACPVVGGYDRLSVGGTATLDGALVVSLLGGYEPIVGTTFDILTAASVIGTFATTNLPVNFMNDCKDHPDYAATFVRLTAVQGGLVTQQPQSQTACAGDPVTFTIAVIGEPPITYQWRRNTVPISGATSSTLLIDPVTVGDAGDYDCIATNICGPRFSAVATLTVNVAPSFSQEPQSQTICEGDPVAFSVTASGTPPPTYQWTKDGNPISGATASIFSINEVVVSDGGDYLCVVTNVCGEIASVPATLTVYVAPTIFNDPAAQSLCAGSSVSFSVTAGGIPSPTYQWRKNGADISGAVASSFMIGAVGPGDAGDYDVVVTNVCGSATSTAAPLTVFATGTGDGDFSGTVNGLDISGFVNAVLSGGPPSPGYCAYDFSGDGVVTTSDLSAFVDELTGP